MKNLVKGIPNNLQLLKFELDINNLGENLQNLQNLGYIIK